MPTLQGKYKVPHFDGKGEADARSARQACRRRFCCTAFYWENFIYFGAGPAARRGRHARAHDADGRQAKLPGIAAEDIGKSAYGIFKRGASSIGKTVGIAGEHLTGEQMAAGCRRRSARR